MSEANKAVFLSYAREDAAAARRIAEALRGFGVEVWFDQNELRGGDQWDAKIRGQIKACALFLPVISDTTQTRDEGYYRLEWKLADDRSHLMAPGKAFIVPVVIDDTAEAGATVPDSFRRAQWVRLAGGEPSSGFVEQVKRLLEPSRKPALKPATDRPPTFPPMVKEAVRARKAAAAAAAPEKRPGVPGWTWGALVAVVAGIGTVWYMAQRPEPAAPEVREADLTPAAPSPAKSAEVATKDDKSIAVLPFTNMSEEKDSAFFTDGIHEDILTNLALIRELRVVSRTSVMQYRGTTKTMKQLAQELGVTYILEGSVRRSGNKVRVSGQLIHAATDEHLWAQSYDRDLTDVFAIQSELSAQIAGALKTALSPEEKALIVRRPTDNTTAYDLYVKARELFSRVGRSAATGIGSSGEPEQEMEALLQAAVRLDPNFVDAWLSLVTVHAFVYGGNVDRSPARLARAREAIDRTVHLAPDSPAVISGLGLFYQVFENDYERAAGQFERLIRLSPNSGQAFYNLGALRRNQGRWPEALGHLRKAIELDPALPAAASVLVLCLNQVRRFDEEVAERRRLVARWPERKADATLLAALEDMLDGTTRATDALIARFEANEADRPRAVALRKQRAAVRSDFAEFARLDRQQPWFDADGGARHLQAQNAALVLLAGGDAPAARARLGNFPAELRKRLEGEPANPRIWQDLGLMEAILGNQEEAVRCARHAVHLMETSPDADRLPLRLASLAAVQALVGDKDGALATLAQLLQIPSTFSGRDLKRHSYTYPLRGDPRFEALVNDPANNQPLF